MGVNISYIIGALCIIFPRVSGNVIAELLDQIAKRKYGAAPPEEKKVRPVFSILLGIVIIFLAYAVDTSNKQVGL